jgi:glycosyltransferase involved in cell wall biosynthesis
VVPVSGRRRIACFSWHYPPAANAEALVVGKWVRAMAAAGHDLSVFSAPQRPAPAGSSARRLAEAAAELLRHAGPALRRDLLDLPFPGPLNEYVSDALERFAAGHAARPFDLVVSRYEPVGSAIAGYLASREAGLPWVLCINDPMPRVVVPRPGPMGLLDAARNRFQRRWSDRLLPLPEALVFPCERLMEDTFERAGIPRGGSLRGRCRVVPHVGGLEGTEALPGAGAPATAARPVVRYLGYLSRVRVVDTLLEGLARYAARPGAIALDVEFVGDCSAQAGPIEALARRALPGLRVSVLPGTDPARAFESMRTAALLALVEEPGARSIFLPSKFCDYAVAGRPILAVSPAEATVADELAAHGGGVRVVHGDPEGVADAVAAALDGRLAGSAQLAERYSGARIAALWDALLAELLPEREGAPCAS